MPISFYILMQVIFVLSTIFMGTHCCSSRILLLKERPEVLQVQEEVQEQQQYDFQVANPDPTDAPLHIDLQQQFNQSSYNNSRGAAVESVILNSLALNKTEKSLLDPGSTKFIEESPPKHAAEFIIDPAVRAQKAGNPDYHVIDIYFTIMRDVLSFECTGQFLADFCLNKGRCFRYPIGNHSFYSCECADGYVGERCESKSLNDFLIPTTSPKTLDMPNPKILTARIVFSFPMLIALSTIYLFIAAIIVFRLPRKH